jgi:hypothetical protein
MDDYEETRLHEPDPPADVRKKLKRRRAMYWVLYTLAAAGALAVALASTTSVYFWKG